MSKYILKNKINIGGVFFNLIITYSIFFLFVVPSNIRFNHARIFIPIFFLILVLIVYMNNATINKKDLILIYLVLIAGFLTMYYESITDGIVISMLILFVSAADFKNINIKYIYILVFIAFISLTYQLYENMGVPGYWEYTSTLSVGDTNFAGFYMLLFFLLCFKIRFWPGIALGLGATFLFLSRTYFLAIIVFLLIHFYKNKIKIVLNRTNFIIILILLNTIIFMASYVLIGMSHFYADTGARGIGRLIVFSDSSAQNRIFLNFASLNLLLSEPAKMLFGFGEVFKESAVLYMGKVSHNSLLSMVGKHGLIFSFIYLLGLNKVINNIGWKRNLEYIVPIIIYSLFLHGIYSKGFLILMTLIMII